MAKPGVVHIAFGIQVLLTALWIMESASTPVTRPEGMSEAQWALSKDAAESFKVFRIVFLAIIGVIFPFLAWLGRNWARIVMLVLWVLGEILFVVARLILGGNLLPDLSWATFFDFMGLLSLALFFVPPANRWYAELRDGTAYVPTL